MVSEREPNNDAQHCQAIPAGPWTVEGDINPNTDRDWWCFVAEAGQQVTFNVDARVLNSPLDSYLYLHEFTRDGRRQVAENDDEVQGQLQDSLLQFEFERSGRYAIEVGAWRERGCDQCFYVLHIETE